MSSLSNSKIRSTWIITTFPTRLQKYLLLHNVCFLRQLNLFEQTFAILTILPWLLKFFQLILLLKRYDSTFNTLLLFKERTQSLLHYSKSQLCFTISLPTLKKPKPTLFGYRILNSAGNKFLINLCPLNSRLCLSTSRILPITLSFLSPYFA